MLLGHQGRARPWVSAPLPPPDSETGAAIAACGGEERTGGAEGRKSRRETKQPAEERAGCRTLTAGFNFTEGMKARGKVIPGKDLQCFRCQDLTDLTIPYSFSLCLFLSDT